MIVSKKYIYIVGNSIIDLRLEKLVNVVSVDDFMRFLKEECDDGSVRDQSYIVGQGVSQVQRQQISKMLHHLSSSFINVLNLNKKSVSQKIVHKKKIENVMISEPVVSLDNNNVYRSELIVDDACDEMSDHTTGLHIQGMVLIESSRQLMLAVSELYLFRASDNSDMYCILQSIASKFIRFTYPLPTNMVFRVNSIVSKDGDRYFANAVVEFYQFGDLTAEVELTFALYPSPNIAARERRMFDEITENSLTKIADLQAV